ncbi:hypothetical protein FACS1894172_17650 [Spirochaetia bacterium]|nr:hypothetical protein FACS1894164_11270 [Spirochaetia bacterium]GHU35616.1 hypothetical protein FACS1894172_17650 [Spirochaetia bacterium]
MSVRRSLESVIDEDMRTRELPGSTDLAQVKQSRLPATIEELTSFVLIGREKLNAVRAAMRAIEKLDVAVDVRRQRLEEAQAFGELLLDAEVRLGELFKALPKAKGIRTDLKLGDSTVPRSKLEKLEELGFSKKQAQRLEALTEKPEAIEQAKSIAHDSGTIPTRELALKLSKEKHVRPPVPAPEIRAVFLELNTLIADMKKTDIDNEAKTRLLDLLTEAKVLLTKSTAKS